MGRRQARVGVSLSGEQPCACRVGSGPAGLHRQIEMLNEEAEGFNAVLAPYSDKYDVRPVRPAKPAPGPEGEPLTCCEAIVG